MLLTTDFDYTKDSIKNGMKRMFTLTLFVIEKNVSLSIV